MSAEIDSAANTHRGARLSGARAAITRLFGPQTSSAARERRDMLVLLFAVTLIVTPHFEHLAWWATAIILLLLFWRIWLTLTQRPLPGRVVMLPLLLAAAGGVYLQHRTLAGQDAGVTFLLLLMALKLLELRARRDVFVVIFLAFFILLTQFLYGQEMHVAATTVAAIVALFFVLVGVNLDDVDLPALRKLRLVGSTLLKAIPLAAVLFVLFPRLSGPLWGMPGDAGRGSTGLSNSMSPGSISRLLESDEIVFRVRFAGAPPTNDRLYWRGPVFGTFNGRTWSPVVRTPSNATTPDIEADPRSAVTYEVTLEPHKRDWLFALEAPAMPPDRLGQNAHLTPEMQLLADGLILERVRYEMRSHTEFRLDEKAPPGSLGRWLELPGGYNPRTLRPRGTRFGQNLAGARCAARQRSARSVSPRQLQLHADTARSRPQLGRRFPVRHPPGILRALLVGICIPDACARNSRASSNRLSRWRAEPDRWIHDSAAVGRARLGRGLAERTGLGATGSDGNRGTGAYRPRSAKRHKARRRCAPRPRRR
jgi:hypothetical protein